MFDRIQKNPEQREIYIDRISHVFSNLGPDGIASELIQKHYPEIYASVFLPRFHAITRDIMDQFMKSIG